MRLHLILVAAFSWTSTTAAEQWPRQIGNWVVERDIAASRPTDTANACRMYIKAPQDQPSTVISLSQRDTLMVTLVNPPVSPERLIGRDLTVFAASGGSFWLKITQAREVNGRPSVSGPLGETVDGRVLQRDIVHFLHSVSRARSIRFHLGDRREVTVITEGNEEAVTALSRDCILRPNIPI